MLRITYFIVIKLTSQQQHLFIVNMPAKITFYNTAFVFATTFPTITPFPPKSGLMIVQYKISSVASRASAHTIKTTWNVIFRPFSTGREPHYYTLSFIGPNKLVRHSGHSPSITQSIYGIRFQPDTFACHLKRSWLIHVTSITTIYNGPMSLGVRSSYSIQDYKTLSLSLNGRCGADAVFTWVLAHFTRPPSI